MRQSFFFPGRFKRCAYSFISRFEGSISEADVAHDSWCASTGHLPRGGKSYALLRHSRASLLLFLISRNIAWILKLDKTGPLCTKPRTDDDTTDRPFLRR